MVDYCSMRRPSLSFLLAALTVLLLVPARLSADLVWTPAGGWKVQGGALTAFSGEEGRNALESMNKARTAEEAGSVGTAFKHYSNVVRKYPNSVYAAEALARLDRTDDAEHLLNAELTAFPANARARTALQALYRASGRTREAAALAKR